MHTAEKCPLQEALEAGRRAAQSAVDDWRGHGDVATLLCVCR